MKRFIVGVVILVSAFTLTACSNSAEDATGRSDGASYSSEWVPMNDGTEVRCLWYKKGQREGSMSCDFDNARPISE